MADLSTVYTGLQHKDARAAFLHKGEAALMLPGLAVTANDAGLMDAQGVISGTDTQTRATVAALVDERSDYVPEAA